MNWKMWLAIPLLLILAACAETPQAAPLPEETAVPEIILPLVATDNPQEAQSSPCDESFQFCTQASISGAVMAEASSWVGSSYNNDCAAWAAGGDPRILELPMMLAVGSNPITVALTRIGAYTGPGTYELSPVSASSDPDMFPSISVNGRAFSNGEETKTTVTVAADGSGSITATGLVEIPSVQSSSIDPAARIDFSMQWTCHETK